MRGYLFRSFIGGSRLNSAGSPRDPTGSWSVARTISPTSAAMIGVRKVSANFSISVRMPVPPPLINPTPNALFATARQEDSYADAGSKSAIVIR
jgi:hypothetical protein